MRLNLIPVAHIEPALVGEFWQRGPIAATSLFRMATALKQWAPLIPVTQTPLE